MPFACKDLADYSAVADDLKAMIQERVNKLSMRKKYPNAVTREVSRILEEKAGGTFLWVGIACDELEQVQARNAVGALQSLPRGLHSLYRKLLETAIATSNKDDKPIILDFLSFVAISQQPLTLSELYEAYQLYPDEDEDSRLQFTRDLVNLCRLMIVIQGEEVRLLHKSVKDFLVKEVTEVNELKSHATLAYRCITYVINCCQPQVHGGIADSEMAFMKYSVLYWPVHAGLAQNEFWVKQEQAEFFLLGSKIWKEWLSHYNSQQRQQQNWNDRLDAHFSTIHAAARWEISQLIAWASRTVITGVYIDSNFRTLKGVTPLEEAASHGNIVTLSALLEITPMDVPIDERVVGAAAGSKKGKEIMTLLLDQRGDQVQITEEVVKAAARNQNNGKEVMTLLLDRRGDQVQITEEVVKAAARNQKNGKEVMTLFLDQRGDQVQITKEVVKAAAGNYWSGKEIITLLLDQQGDQVQITEEVVKAAAGNYHSGKEIMILLLDQQGDQLQITEEVVKAAAENWKNGKEVMTLLLDRQGDQVQITEEVVKAAAMNNRSGKEITALLLLQLESQIKHGQNRLQMSCWVGDISTVKYLLTLGSNINIPNQHGWNPLHAACWNGHTDVVKILLSYNSSVNATSNTGWSPLDIAFTHGYIDIIRALLQQRSDNTYYFSPTCFSDIKSDFLDLDCDKLGVKYIGTVEKNGSLVPGLLYANRPLSPLEDVFYFEIEILCLGHNGEIGLGLSIDGSPLEVFPGWNSASWGYHGDDGKKFHCGGQGQPYGESFREGDIIGCRLEIVSGELEFSINGRYIGVAFTNVRGYLFPVVGMSSYGAHIRANFTGPFIYHTKNSC